MITLFENIGAYFILLSRVFKKPDNYKLIFKQTIHEMVSLGIGSLGLIAIISVFMGAVVTIQTATNMTNPLLPGYLVQESRLY